MYTDGVGVVHYLTRRTHKSGSKVQKYVCIGQKHNLGLVIVKSDSHWPNSVRNKKFPVKETDDKWKSILTLV